MSLARPGCLEVDAERSEFGGARLLRRAREHIATPGDFKPFEAGRLDSHLELCFQQSAGDSALPEVDVALGRVGHRLFHENVAELKTAANAQHSMHFA